MTSRTHGGRRRGALLATLLLALCAVPAFNARADTHGPCSDSTMEGGDWPTYGQDVRGQQRQGKEQSITPDNAGSLEEVWKTGIIGGSGATPGDTGYQSPPPIVSGGCVFINDHGRIVGIDLVTGDRVWTSPERYEGTPLDTSGTFAVTVVDGLVHASLKNGGRPRPVAFDVHTQEVAWLGDPVTFVQDPANPAKQPQAGQQSSAIVVDGIRVLFTTGPDFDPTARQGYALYRAATGEKLAEHLAIPEDGAEHGYVSSGVWGTPTYDPASKMLFVGTSNPESKTTESPYDNAIIEIDLDETRSSFGTIVDSYKGVPDSQLYDNPVCQSPVGSTAYVTGTPYGSSPTCGQLDVDFGVGPTLWQVDDKLFGAATQKSGVLHIFEVDDHHMTWAATKQLWPSMAFLGGNIARIATDGETLYVAANPGMLYAFEAHPPFREKWAQPLTGVPMKGGNVALANDVVFYVDDPGLRAFNTNQNGMPIPIPGAAQLGSSIGSGVAIAGNYVVANHYGVIAAYKLPDT